MVSQFVEVYGTKPRESRRAPLLQPSSPMPSEEPTKFSMHETQFVKLHPLPTITWDALPLVERQSAPKKAALQGLTTHSAPRYRPGTESLGPEVRKAYSHLSEPCVLPFWCRTFTVDDLVNSLSLDFSHGLLKKRFELILRKRCVSRTWQ
jgi:hypothetical protein